MSLVIKKTAYLGSRSLRHARPLGLRSQPLVSPKPSGTFSTTAARLDRDSQLARSTEEDAVEETQDVNAMDRLLKAVRKKTNPSHSSMVPIRSNSLWSETLLRGAALGDPEQTVTQQDHPNPLVPRNMHDSYCEITLPFTSKPELLEQYTNAFGGIRTGMLLENLDSLAGGIAYKHMLGPGVDTLSKDAGFYMVTASVDRLDALSPIYPVRDMRLSGQVIHVGRSSMEVAVRMEAIEKSGKETTIMLGRFCMVCRDARTHKAAPVNPLIIKSHEDKLLFKMGEVHKARRQLDSIRSLTRVPPTSQEAEALHSMFLKYGQDEDSKSFTAAEGERVWMGDTRLEKCLQMFPQERNVHQKIFGGYLMRLAYELGFANSALFTRGHVKFLSSDSIRFEKPVPIGSILRLTSHILHTSSSETFPAIVHVGVQANVVDVATGTEQTTNDFRFTWCKDQGEPLNRRVVPRTYKEAMEWLEGKRALEMGAEIRGIRTGPKSVRWM